MVRAALSSSCKSCEQFLSMPYKWSTSSCSYSFVQKFTETCCAEMSEACMVSADKLTLVLFCFVFNVLWPDVAEEKKLEGGGFPCTVRASKP